MSTRRDFIGRRSFLGKAAGAAITASAAPLVTTTPAAAESRGDKLRLALIGTGIRGSSRWGRDIIAKYGDVTEMVGLCDINPKRLAYAKDYMKAKCPTYTDFDKMVTETKPDTVLVMTMDSTHAKYICRAMELGCDVIAEKPMCTDEKMVQDIIDTEKYTGRHVAVAFNYRFGPAAQKIKEILRSGVIGQVTSVDYNYYLDTDHGASYFRRWHAFKQFSGSLFVHKATHHFDLLNWWLEAEPVEVNAYGELRTYGHNSPFRGVRCMTCPHKKKCNFYYDITKSEHMMNLYVKPESEDGYMRDACLFRNTINSWDTMAAQVRYHNKVLLSYSLNAFMPYEGFRVGFNGTKGRLDMREYHREPWENDIYAAFRVTENFKNTTETFNIESGGGGHWGADEKMQNMMFRGPMPDPLGQTAGSRQGAMSVLIGVAARRSIEQQRPIFIEELVKI